MLIVMAVSLFTVRVVLDVLGAEDYGINNVVGGVVTMFAFLTSTMVSAAQRFFAYSLGRKDYDMLSKYFSMSFWCYAAMALAVVIIAETLGLWFVNTQLNIPTERHYAAMWVYQFAILTFFVNILSVPYNSIIIAREKMNIYAVLGLLEVFLKLGLAYLLMIAPGDKLIVYAGLMFLTTVSISLFYIGYGTKNFPECRLKRLWDVNIFKEVLNYSGWSLFGAISGVLRSQGINILLNIFFNPIVNAARAIAFQINNAINQFVLNFFKAVQPQITKYYASSDRTEMMKLIYRTSRYCFYLILALSLPLLMEMEFVLGLWLKEVPENTALFARLVIITAIIDSTAYPLQTAISATGNIKWFQIVTGGMLILNLPISWIALSLGLPPESTMYIAITIALISQASRIIFAKMQIDMSIMEYTKDVILHIFCVLATTLVSVYAIKMFMHTGVLSSALIIFLSVSITCFSVYLIGIPSSERKVLNQLLMKIIKNDTRKIKRFEHTV